MNHLHWRYWPSLNTTFFPPKIWLLEQLLGVSIFWVKNIHRLFGFCFEKAGIVFCFSMEIPNQKKRDTNSLTKKSVKGSEFIVSTNCFTAPRVLVKCMRIRNVQKPLLNVDRTSFCGQKKGATIFFHPCRCGGCFVFFLLCLLPVNVLDFF